MNIPIRARSFVLVSLAALLAPRPARAGESTPEAGPKAQAGARTSYFHEATVGQPAVNGLSIGPHVGYNLPLPRRALD